MGLEVMKEFKITYTFRGQLFVEVLEAKNEYEASKKFRMNMDLEGRERKHYKVLSLERMDDEE